MSVPTVLPDELREFMANGQPVQLIDVRTPVEFREIHAVGARSIPLDRLNPAALPPAEPGAPPGSPCESWGPSPCSVALAEPDEPSGAVPM